jgi:hypothetical protein
MLQLKLLKKQKVSMQIVKLKSLQKKLHVLHKKESKHAGRGASKQI